MPHSWDSVTGQPSWYPAVETWFELVTRNERWVGHVLGVDSYQRADGTWAWNDASLDTVRYWSRMAESVRPTMVETICVPETIKPVTIAVLESYTIIRGDPLDDPGLLSDPPLPPP